MTWAWVLPMVGLMVGALGAWIPGFPGSAVAFLGLAAFASATDYAIVGGPALALAAWIALLAALGQIVAPVWGTRTVSSAAGAATGASVGVLLGAVTPLPLGAWLLGSLGAVLGAFTGRGRLGSRLAVPLTLFTGAMIAVIVDGLAVLAIGAVLAWATFISSWA